MEIQRFSEVKKVLTSKFTLVTVFLCLLLGVDYAFNSQGLEKIMQYQFELRGMSSPFKTFAIFGTFDNVYDLTRRFEIFLIALGSFFVLGPLFFALVGSLRMRESK